MTNTNTAFGLSKGVTLKFHTLRDFSTKSDQENYRRLWISQINTKELVKKDPNGDFLVDDSKNVRGFLKTNSSGEKNAKSGVHAIVYSSLEDNSEDFNLLNGGITIIARGCEVDNNNKTITLANPSIINGTQTRGVLDLFHQENPDKEIPIKVEILVILKKEENWGLDVEIAIARNRQNNVKTISVSGKRGEYEELDKVVEQELQKNESQKGKFDTLKLIQLLFLILPNDMWENHLHRPSPSRASIYSGKNKWNNLWSDIWKERDGKYKVAFEFFMQIANPVLKFYLSQKNSSILNGCGKQIKKDSGSYTINKDGSYNIKDGWLFPLISCMSNYIVEREEDKKWELVLPPKESIKGIFALIYNYGQYSDFENVQSLGKNRVAYDTTLRLIEKMSYEDLENEAKKVFK